MTKSKKKLAKAKKCFHPHHPICCIVPPHMLREVIERGNALQRAWAFQTLSLSERIRGRREALGNLLGITPAGEKRRTIYDAKNSTELPGKLVRGEGDPPSHDEAVNEAYDATGATYDFFQNIYGRNSIDDRGMRLDSTVHYDIQYDNAFWDGSQMVYGDGDGEIFQRFTKSIDVIAHELTHGVTQHEARLIYWGQPGALNESFSDVFGTLVKQWLLQQTVEEADWIIGKELFTPNINGVGIRSMQAPGTAYNDPVLGKDPQPAHVNDMYRGSEDNGGVHINSGIPNYAFYIAAMEIGGYAWEKTGRIWYITLRDRLRPWSNFKAAADRTIGVAEYIYGVNSKEQKAVRHAWEKVGVL
ncbi:MAG TPA: M4 family metallopeptidase [Leptolyngbyaceae cyanobacterium]